MRVIVEHRDESEDRPRDFPELVPPDGRLLWTSPEMVTNKGRPQFSTKEVASLFFARSRDWLYLALSTKRSLSHSEVGVLEVPRVYGRGGFQVRQWRLYDVELYAHLLASHRMVSGIHLAQTVTLVKVSAQMWGFL